MRVCDFSHLKLANQRHALVFFRSLTFKINCIDCNYVQPYIVQSVGTGSYIYPGAVDGNAIDLRADEEPAAEDSDHWYKL